MPREPCSCRNIGLFIRTANEIRLGVLPQSGKVDRLSTVQALTRFRQRVLQAIGTVEQNTVITAADASGRQFLLPRSVCRCAFGTQQETFPMTDFVQTGQDYLVIDCGRKAMTFPNSLQDQKVANGHRNPDS